MAPPLRRSELLNDRSLSGRSFCDAYGTVVEEWLSSLWDDAIAVGPTDGGGVALVAVGGQGRGELCPQSDLDLLLLTGPGVDAKGVADRLWYPIWDEGLKLGHAVRSVRDTLALASDDLETATALLSARHIAGDPDLTAELGERARLNWHRKGRRWLDLLGASVDRRHVGGGEVAFDLEPDLKEGRGGLRDIHALMWARDAGADIDDQVLAALRPAHDLLLEVRVELHRVTGRPGDVLTLSEQDLIAPRLGDSDADALMGRVSVAGREIAWNSDEIWHDIRSTFDAPRFSRLRRERSVGDGLVLRNGRIESDGGSMSMLEPLDVLRVAVAAARSSGRVSPALLRTLDTVPPVSGTWSDETREAFVELLDSGPSAIAVVESLDHGVSWSRLIPEWNQVRSRIQRNALHRFTVDRHLLETASEASQLSTPTRRDLLLVAALLHDIGKGSEGDHSEVGERVAREIATRMGFPPEDVSVIAHAVRHHLLLPDVATRRDLDDPATVGAVAGVVGTTEQLSLLRALAQADGIATGPSAWTQWRAQLVDQLTNRVAQVITGAAAPTSGHGPFPTAEQRGLLELGGVQIRTVGDAITVACPDRPGVFHRVAGVLALHGLDVLSAAIHSEGGMALDEFRVGIGPSGTIPWERVTDDVAKVLEGRLAVHARLDERVRTRRARRRPGVHQLPQAVRFDDDASEEATVLEVTGADSIGLLYRLTRALTDMDIDIRTAKIHTMGADVVDTFYVVTATGEKVTDDDLRAELRRALLHALEPLA